MQQGAFDIMYFMMYILFAFNIIAWVSWGAGIAIEEAQSLELWSPLKEHAMDWKHL